MAETAADPAFLELDAPIVRRQRRFLRIALAYYLPAGVIFTAAAAWAATRPGDSVAAALIGIGAVQVDYYAPSGARSPPHHATASGLVQRQRRRHGGLVRALRDYRDQGAAAGACLR